MIAEIPASALQIPDYALWMVGGWVLTTLIAGFSGYRWGLKSQVSAKKLEFRTSLLPLIEKFIIRANGKEWYALRPDSIDRLFEPTMKLKSVLTGSNRKRLIHAWEIFSKTTKEEFHVAQPGDTGKQEQAMRKTFVDRLNALHKIVESC